MKYFPHQRSLPPLPDYSHINSSRWQSSSLPTKYRHRSQFDIHRSPLNPRYRNWSSYLDVGDSRDDYNYYRSHSPSSYLDYNRSVSTHNLYDLASFDSRYYPISDHYSSDELISLHLRHLDSLEKQQVPTDTYFDNYNRTPKYDYHMYRSDYSIHSNSRRRHSPGRDTRDEIDTYYSDHSHVNRSQSSHHRYRKRSPVNTRKYNENKRRSRHVSAERNPGTSSISASVENKSSRGISQNSFPLPNQPKQNLLDLENIESVRTDYSSKNSSNPSRFVIFKQSAPKHCTQILATLVVSLGPLCAGLGKGYSSPALASMAILSAQGQHFVITKDQGSWIASLSLLGAFFGSLPAGMSINWGRKKVLYTVSVPFALAWVLTVVASNVYMLYIAAFLAGICTAIVSFVTPVYISEIAHPEIRGCLCAFSKLNSHVGMLISYLLGAVMNWRKLAMVTAVVPTFLFIASIFIPETPSFLLYKGRYSEATEALKWLRGSKNDVSRELNVMKSNIEAFRSHQSNRTPLRITTSRNLIRPLFITCGLMFFQKFSGANAFNFYAVPILSETFVGLNPYRAAVVVAFVQICAGLASSALVDTVGRRPLLVFSNMLMAAALTAFGFYVYFKGLSQNDNLFSNQEWKESDWVPLFCILVIEIAYALGVSPISWLYIGEIFPLKHRSYGALAGSVSYVCSFASVKTFVDLQNGLGLYGAFWFYATFATLALIFTLLFVPETKGKSLQEMQVLEQQKETLI